jgi:hypothetical protein
MVVSGGACIPSSAPAGGEGLSRREAPLVECPAGISLPDEKLDGYVVQPPFPAQEVTGLITGTLVERAPTLFDYGAMVAYVPGSGIQRHGWLIDAAEGEEFAYQITLD